MTVFVNHIIHLPCLQVGIILAQAFEGSTRLMEIFVEITPVQDFSPLLGRGSGETAIPNVIIAVA